MDMEQLARDVQFIKDNTTEAMNDDYRRQLQIILSDGFGRIDKLTDEQLDGILND